MQFNWSERISPTIRNIPPSGIRRFFDMASEMKGVISLGVGEPDFVTPWNIRETGISSLRDGYTMYTSNAGLLELREEIARHLHEWYNVRYEPRSEVLVTVGVSEAVDLALRTIIHPGDEVLIAEPCYVSYSPCTVMAGGVAVPLPSDAANEFRITAEQLEAAITPRTKALLINYPNNPTGATMPREELLKIAKVVEKHDLIVISDEVYDKLTYVGEHTCFAELPGMRDRTILLNGFSKAYAMTGWRLGYACGHPEVIAAMTKIHQYTMICAPITTQRAAVEALRNGTEEMKQMVASYDQRRRLVLKGFEEIGLSCFEPKGAFYAFPSIKATGMTSEQFAQRLLESKKVAVVPGNVLGECGEGHIRCSYASSVQNLTEAIERMGSFLHELRQQGTAIVSG
ncbi:aminotransferase class I/II-fold pyridoxal phosphate-dependent enzyme [Paenibacillus doosanensis]|uniref:Aminotransferase n=1 Tax=Paenibacillus konkukensis TaxID=2020716 RepID=A0ABY4RJG4_9BACL|nr:MULTISPECIES: aminotransferase class I/II-fold pyridoxal phosphate-dependent enzyme [Paenibacillus]MCS7462604.1 aminotransferase class I/II-fold pyridoxal phosphate-dependent enzyme [Paenibacillus doosanensis]UQZ82576.1 Putative N-acetyl-LL-diaminopimelate aminotransferase [Paenibacillus konkukensis]